jgi:methyl-accepting chemotaxis protein
MYLINYSRKATMWNLSFFYKTIQRRLISGFAGVLLLLMAVAATSLYGMQNMAQQLSAITEVNAKKVKLAMQLLSNVNMLSVHSRNAVIFTDVNEIDVSVKLANRTLDDYLKTQKDLWELAQTKGATYEERQLLKELIQESDRFIAQLRELIRLGNAGDISAATTMLTTTYQPQEKAWTDKLEQVIKVQDGLSDVAAQQAKASQLRVLTLEGALVLLSLALGASITWVITRSITSPIKRAVSLAERIAHCDLTSDIEISTADEDMGRLLRAMSSMQQRLHALVGHILEAVDSIHVSSAEVASGNLDLSFRTEETSSNLQSASSALDTLAQAFNTSVQSAATASELAAQSASKAQNGGLVVAKVVQRMEEINKSSNKISDIIGVIDGIAFQTNILALNAAVEAARAGEQGRGFAVVASEVRSLAVRAADAAKEIKSLIGSSVELVQDGAAQASVAGVTMNDIVVSVQGVSTIVEEITSSTSQESSEINTVSKTIAYLDEVAQQNAALVEQSAAAVQALKDQADNLAKLVGVFRLNRDTTLAYSHDSIRIGLTVE